MSEAGKKIIAGLKDAVAYAQGDKSRGKTTVYVWSRCGCCDQKFIVPKDEKDSRIFCKVCDPDDPH